MYEEIFDGIKELRVMSQEKVDQYKKEKANRKQNMRKEKLHNVLRKCMVGLVGVLLVGWIGWSEYGCMRRKGRRTRLKLIIRRLRISLRNLKKFQERLNK